MKILEGKNPEIVCFNCHSQDFDLAVHKVKTPYYNENNEPVEGFISLFFECKECKERMNIAFSFDLNKNDDILKIKDAFVNKYDSDSRLPSEEQEKIESK